MREGSFALHALRVKAGLLGQLADMMETSPPRDADAFADAVTALIHAGIPAKEMARRFNVDTSTVHDWSKGRTEPHRLALISYARHVARIARDHSDLHLDACRIPLPKAA